MSSSECSCKVLDALKFSGVSDAQESLPILFSVTYSPKVSIQVFLDVKHAHTLEGEQVSLLGTMPRYDSLITYKFPKAALPNSTVGQSYFFPLLLKLSLHHSDVGLICRPVTVPYPVTPCCSLQPGVLQEDCISTGGIVLEQIIGVTSQDKGEGMTVGDPYVKFHLLPPCHRLLFPLPFQIKNSPCIVFLCVFKIVFLRPHQSIVQQMALFSVLLSNLLAMLHVFWAELFIVTICHICNIFK